MADEELEYEAIEDAEERLRKFYEKEAESAEDAAAKAKVYARGWQLLREELGAVAGPTGNIDIEVSLRRHQEVASAARRRADDLHRLAGTNPAGVAHRVAASIRAEAEGQEAEHVEWGARARNPEAFIGSVEHLHNLDPKDQVKAFAWEEAVRRATILGQREVIDEYEALAEDAPPEQIEDEGSPAS